MDIIQEAVDVCVEILQLGVVRSLNVHVNAAIAIWDYTRQQRARSSSSSGLVASRSSLLECKSATLLVVRYMDQNIHDKN